jgi:hypothetical protein
MGQLLKFWNLNRSEKTLLCEASIMLLFSNAFIKIVRFKHIDRFLRSHWGAAIEAGNGLRGGDDLDQKIRAIVRSVSRAAIVLPFKSLCLSRSIVKFIMLRRRGIPAVLSAGARVSGQSALEAHAWVDTGLGLTGARSENSDFKTVIRIGAGASQH